MAQPLEIEDGIFQVSLAWGMVYILIGHARIGHARSAIIDTGLRQDRPALQAALAAVGQSETTIDAVYLTHAHCDHAGNAAWFGSHGARIFIGTNEAKYFQPPARPHAPEGLRRALRPFSTLSFLIGERMYPVERRSADVLLTHGDTVESPVGPLRVISTPGHTTGHISFYRSSDGLLFSGDAILNIRPFQRIVTLSLPVRLFSDDWEQVKRSARELAALQPMALLPGHGPALTENVAASIEAWVRTL